MVLLQIEGDTKMKKDVASSLTSLSKCEYDHLEARAFLLTSEVAKDAG